MEKKLRGHGRRQDPHQKQYVPPPFRFGGHNDHFMHTVMTQKYKSKI